MKPRRMGRFWLLGVFLGLVLAGFVLTALAANAESAAPQQGPSKVILPAVLNSAIAPSQQLCRLGVSGTPAIGDYAVRPLKLGWYLDWTATAQPARPDGISYIPMIRLKQTAANAYEPTPSAAELPGLVAKQRGAIWVIGNEPDRVTYQDDVAPGVYARAYHDLYQIIKQADPSARVAIAGVVQPTPLRRQYLDLVLQAYETLYGKQPDGTSMPVDVWTVHAFILHERSCVAFPYDCWGAEIPPGVPATEGMLYTIDDHDRLDIFKEFITTFRQWMADRGYRDRPLLITEFGILWPPDYGTPPFDATRVNAFMQATFDFLASATGPTGYPADEHRLVQGWAWYQLDEPKLNGTLFDRATHQRTVFGDKFTSLAATMPGDVNLRPLTASAVRTGSGSSEKVLLSVTVANSGNSAIPSLTSVRFYQGNPAAGGTPIATEPWVYTLGGCGSTLTLTSTWTGAPASSTELWAVVDPGNWISERNETDNRLPFTLAAR